MSSLDPLLPRVALVPRRSGDLLGSVPSLVKVADMGVVVGSGLFAYAMRVGQPALPEAPRYTYALLAAAALTLLVFGRLSLYRQGPHVALTMVAGRVLTGWAIVLSTLMSIGFLSATGAGFSRLWFLYWAGCGGAGLLCVRYAMKGALAWLHSHEIGRRRIALLGPPECSDILAKSIQRQPCPGIELLQVPMDLALGGTAGLSSWLEDQHVGEVWVTWPMREEARLRHSVAQLDACCVDACWIPDLFACRPGQSCLEEMSRPPMLALSVRPLTGLSRALKEATERVLASVIVVASAPLMLALAAGVKLSGPGPVLFRQTRQGWDGRPFELWKFRSMQVHDAATAASQTSRGDQRVTRFGAFLRRTSLDELPQFLNVLQGDMAIVGPRPHALAHNAQYQELVPNYLQRQRVKPGITGWAQVNGLRGETDTVEKMHRRVQHDLAYIQHWSLWLDLSIIAQTCVIVLFDRDAY
ncbi:undecaprenyl-phosphate glucose phosphotransferase [Xanthomonas arboricola]|uniref:Undecaprenyl-phosphate glucose phosphotransferase n=1 Tax=Xanthomonas arboricola pv. guizotiae TaxID=487867 RepID=A0A2S7A1T6_9XANT|nr:undecaprenyl-phosphate glucose phosphotransferase [Xanthomonas arboricola]PPT99690.1 undecaprenyl-phosphate glucose phosphotransferase [Xanthomonas arboricola pv. guizotiae]PPU22747.1 undecaprenyl-phosphate glucose phosphotransferase [Xanthomonas arboricola pv. guizotiae]